MDLKSNEIQELEPLNRRNSDEQDLESLIESETTPQDVAPRPRFLEEPKQGFEITEWLKYWSSTIFSRKRSAPYYRRILYTSLAVLAVVFIFLASNGMTNHQFSHFSDTADAEVFAKPSDVKVIGVVFYGRRHFVEILDCYLRRNLARNGGWLDEVRFVMGTEDREDLEWVSNLVDSVSDYSAVFPNLSGGDIGKFEDYWRQSTEPGTINVKIDDDMVWIDDNAIPRLVHTLLTHPSKPVSVLSNLINSAALGWLRRNFGAVHSYLPELELPEEIDQESYGPNAWRASNLPTWRKALGTDFQMVDTLETPHRWLPLPADDTSWTPIENSEYNPWGNDWADWRIAAQKHYSFLQDLETASLSKYHYGEDGTWNLHGTRGNINLMAIRADDVYGHGPFESVDEEWFTTVLPAKLKRPALVQTKSLAAHFAFGPQSNQLGYTDLLSRYRAYANEMICEMEI